MSHHDVNARDAFAEVTKPDADAIARLTDRLESQVISPASARALVRHVPVAPRQAIERIRARLQRRRDEEPRYWRYVAAFGALMSSGTAVAVVAIVLFALLPTPVEPVAPISAVLKSSEAVDTSPMDGVRLRYVGSGDLDVRDGQPTIKWQSGNLDIDVDHGRGIELTILTQEGAIEVIGTMLAVERSALGTEVSVSHGLVEVTCVKAEPLHVSAGEAAVCEPVTAAGRLGRARHLQLTGASSPEVLLAVDSGLAIAEGPVKSELLAFRIQHLLSLERTAEALDAAEAYLDSGIVLRRADIQSLAADLALVQDGCERALPHLRGVAKAPGAADVEVFLRLADCSTPRSAEERDALVLALEVVEDPTLRKQIMNRLGSVGR